MWNVKSTLLFVASLIAVILISISMANADEKKTITPKEFANNVSQVPGKLVTFIQGEVDKTKEYQKKSWADMKTKWPWTMFKGKDNE
tara:strand:- start:206 stop:466 length:261 start_codon:yes stop_codon:yes gene_type:complete